MKLPFRHPKLEKGNLISKISQAKHHTIHFKHARSLAVFSWETVHISGLPLSHPQQLPGETKSRKVSRILGFFFKEWVIGSTGFHPQFGVESCIIVLKWVLGDWETCCALEGRKSWSPWKHATWNVIIIFSGIGPRVVYRSLRKPESFWKSVGSEFESLSILELVSFLSFSVMIETQYGISPMVLWWLQWQWTCAGLCVLHCYIHPVSLQVAREEAWTLVCLGRVLRDRLGRPKSTRLSVSHWGKGCSLCESRHWLTQD